MRHDIHFLSTTSPSRKALLSITLLILFVFGAFIPARAQDNTTTTAQPTISNENETPTDEHPPLFITFTPINKSSSLSPNATFGCSIPYPTVTDNFTNQSASWSGSISCSVPVGLYGTTILYIVNGVNVAYGNQINTTSTFASSSGSYYGLVHGQTYAVNFNVDITPPSGYTTSPGGGCSYISGGPRVHCTVGSGAFTQP